MKFFNHLPRFVAAAAFAASASTAVVVNSALNAGAPATGLLASAPQAASAAVSIGIGIGVGPRYYPRYAWRGGTWVRFGFGYGVPGYAGGYYYGPPPVGFYPPGYFVHPVYYAHPYWYGGRYVYGPRYYGHPYWGEGGYRIHPDGGYYRH